MTLCNRAQGLEGTPSWGTHTSGVSSSKYWDHGDSSTESGQLGKVTASPPPVQGSVCPAPVWLKLQGPMAAGTGQDQ